MSDALGELLPCQFCGGAMKHTESLAKSFSPPRLYHEYAHPDNGCVVLAGRRFFFTDDGDRGGRAEFLAAWNRPAPASAEPVATEATEDARNQMWDLRRVDAPNVIYRDEAIRVLGSFAADIRSALSLAPSTTTGDVPCECCGRDALVWHAPNALWNLVMGGPEASDDPGGLLCPNCFILKAEEAGIRPSSWELRPDTPALAPASSSKPQDGGTG